MERELPPSAKKLRKAVERGDLPRSEVSASVGTVIGFAIFVLNHRWADDLAELSGFFLELHSVDSTDIFLRSMHGLLFCGRVLGAATVHMASVALLTTILTGGVVGRGFAVTCRFEHLGATALWAKVKSAPAKVLRNFLSGLIYAVIGLGLALMVGGELGALAVGDLSVADIVFAAWHPVFIALPWGVSMLIAFAGFEVWSARRRFRRKMSMSLIEQREEAREEYGDPQVRRARRELWQGLANADLETRIRKSKVIIVDSLG